MKMGQNQSRRKRMKNTELMERDRECIEKLRRDDWNRRQVKKLFLRLLQVVIVTAAIAVLVSHYILSVVEIYGSTMAPTLYAGDTVVCLRNTTYDTGDVVAFYYNNHLQVKRVIAKAGDWVDIDEEGCVLLNDEELDEPYLFEQTLGSCDIELPYQVPDGCVFVMGDNRGISIDSRCTEIGAIEEARILGKLIFKIWPFPDAGLVH